MAVRTQALIDAAISAIKLSPDARPGDCPLELLSTVTAPANTAEIEAAWSKPLPEDAVLLWSRCREARLFVDVEYGQWGLVLLDPAASAKRTAQALEIDREDGHGDYRADDVVIGEFLGDANLLVVNPTERAERRMLIALPMDPRDEWPGVGSGIGEFLERYIKAHGDKFWEP